MAQQINSNNNISSYLNEIAERLWSGHATMIVGSGFSKNATRRTNSSAEFPTWAGLGDLFLEKLHGRDCDKNYKYLSVPKLAEQFEAAFGRPALDKLLRESIPDWQHEPSPLHIKLMELPWADVFTTNYDTLLEKACESVVSRRYDIVVNKEDIIYSEKPRIIKLHGSFPSERPFIITEEDFRRYPRDFAPFINTVQQSLLENTMCLIGFSGDDPNFLAWIGWIRDNLGSSNSPKMYLIGTHARLVAEIQLLAQKNIVFINMSELAEGADENEPHYKAMERFIEYLAEKSKNYVNEAQSWANKEKHFITPSDDNKDMMSRQNPKLSRGRNHSFPNDTVIQEHSRNNEYEAQSWADKEKHFIPHFADKKDISEKIQELLKEWRETRLSYPGWVVPPMDCRSAIWARTRSWTMFLPEKGVLSDREEFDFAFELVWRMEKCLFPMFESQVNFFEVFSHKFLETGDKADREKSLDMLLFLMSCYRQDGFLDRWDSVEGKIESMLGSLSLEQLAKFRYERVLQALFALDVPKVKDRLAEWEINESLPLWEAKRAAIMAEFGQFTESVKILEQSLKTIRQSLNLNPVSKNYSLVSQEAIVIFLLQNIKFADNISRGNFRKEDDDRKKEQDFFDRLNELKRFKCDPRNELMIFEKTLEREPSQYSNVVENKEFDIGRVSVTHNLGGRNEEAELGFNFLLFCENCGIPFRISNVNIATNSAAGAIRRMLKYSPYWAIANIVRLGDAEKLDNIFNRKWLSVTDIHAVDDIAKNYVRILSNIPDEEKSWNQFFGVLTEILPEALSRLCCKCSNETKMDILNFVIKIFPSSNRWRYRNINDLMKRLIDSFSTSKCFALIPKFLEFAIVKSRNIVEGRDFISPFEFISFLNSDIVKNWDKPAISEEKVNELLDKAMEEDEIRKEAILRLGTLFSLKLLNEEQTERFGQVLWSKVDDGSKLPTKTPYRFFAFFNLPCPKDVKHFELVQKNILTIPFPIQKKKKTPGVSMTSGEVRACIEIAGANKDHQWTDADVRWIFERIIEWWDSDKEYLLDNNEDGLFNRATEFMNRFRNMVHVIVEVIAPNFAKGVDENQSNELMRLINEFEKYGVPSLRVRAACLQIYPDIKEVLLDGVKKALVSSDKEKVAEAFYAMLIMVNNNLNDLREELKVLVAMAGQMIMWQYKTGLANTITAMKEIIKKAPSLLNSDTWNAVIVGLNSIAVGTSRGNPRYENDYEDMFSVRQKAARLAYTIFLYHKGEGKEIPAQVRQWEDICRDTNEFAEIRNQWE